MPVGRDVSDSPIHAREPSEETRAFYLFTALSKPVKPGAVCIEKGRNDRQRKTARQKKSKRKSQCIRV